MITKKEYIKGEVESAWGDHKFITQVLYDYFNDQVKNMTNKEFKEYLENMGWEKDNQFEINADGTETKKDSIL